MQLTSHRGLLQVLSYPMFAGTHFTYPQRDGGLSQLPARLSQEWVLNSGPVTWWSAALPTELSLLGYIHTYVCMYSSMYTWVCVFALAMYTCRYLYRQTYMSIYVWLSGDTGWIQWADWGWIYPTCATLLRRAVVLAFLVPGQIDAGWQATQLMHKQLKHANSGCPR